MTTAAASRQVSTQIVERTLDYASYVLGAGAADRAFERCGLAADRDRLTEPGGWCSVEEALRVAEAVAALCGDPDLGRRVGEELFHQQGELQILEFIRATGSIWAALDMTVDYAAKMSVGRSFAQADRGSHHVEVVSTYVDPSVVDERHRFFCGLTTGYFSLLPSLFGVIGAATEHSCLARGDDRCVLRIVWRGTPEDDGVPAPGAGDAHIVRFEELQAMAAELATAPDARTLLDQVVQHVGTAVMAPRTLLVVRLPGEAQHRAHHLGLDERAADDLVAQLLDGTLATRHDVLCVPVASARTDFGHLAVVVAPGSQPQAMDRRFLHAFAGHAAAALEAIVALDAARRDHATADALLALARSLATVGDTDDLAARLVDAVPRVTGADLASVWLWDEATATLACPACVPADAGLAGLVLEPSALPELAEMAATLEPRTMHADSASPALADVMAITATRYGVGVPITAHGEFLGIVIAGWSQAELPTDEHDLSLRLRGLADHAAAALENSRLLETVRHQAMHDALTGLPNRPLVEDRAHQALAAARRDGAVVGLLFVDLDRFKEVNDGLGHAAGDELICAVAARLLECFRASDTVARQGGDELLVLLPDLPDEDHAVLAAHKVRMALARPFTIAGHRVAVTASVGVACSPAGSLGYDALLRQADHAMYEAKADGRDRVARYDDGAFAEASSTGSH